MDLLKMAPRWAGVVDLENVVIPSGAHRGQNQLVLEGLKPHLTDMPVRAATGMLALRPLVGCLDPGWGLTVVGPEADAADTALLEVAHDFINRGVTDLVVASGDHAFAGLAAIARLHVVSHPQKLSNLLRMAATSVTELRALPSSWMEVAS